MQIQPRTTRSTRKGGRASLGNPSWRCIFKTLHKRACTGFRKHIAQPLCVWPCRLKCATKERIHLANAGHSRSEWSGVFEGPSASSLVSGPAKTPPARSAGRASMAFFISCFFVNFVVPMFLKNLLDIFPQEFDENLDFQSTTSPQSEKDSPQELQWLPRFPKDSPWKFFANPSWWIYAK